MDNTLSAVCALIADCEHKTAPTQANGFPSVRTPNIGRGRLILEGVNRVAEEIYREWTRRAVPQAGDLVLAREAPVGNIAIIPPGLKICLGQRTVLIRPDREKVNPHYLLYFLLSDRVQGRIQSMTSGAAVGHLNVKDIRDLDLPELPSLSTQTKIGNVLSSYDDLIENNTRRIRILEEMAQAVYREWFVHFRFPGHKKVKLVPSPLGPIPTAWRVGSIAEAVSLSREGIDPGDYRQEIFQLFSIPAFDQGRLPTLDHGESIKSNKFLVQESNLLLSKLNPRIPRVWLPLFCGTYRAIASTEFLVLTPRKPFTREFLYCAYSSSEFAGLLAGRALGTSTSHQRVKPEDFLRMDVLIPSDDQLLNFTAHVAPMLSAGDTLRLKNANLRRTRDLLLPKLISGALDVSDLDINVEDAA